MPTSPIKNISMQELLESEIFQKIQMQQIFPDGKTFVDCSPKYSLNEINTKYILQKDQPGFSLQKFVLENFNPPVPHSKNYHSDLQKTVEQNIEKLCSVLIRQPTKNSGTLISLPFPYVVPG